MADVLKRKKALAFSLCEMSHSGGRDLKSKYLRLASVLLVLCMITTCGVSKTFAKYTESAEASDSARVAKWGVSVSVEGDSAFSKQYKKDEAVTVESTVKVVAPGTEGTLVSVNVSGKPEVAVTHKVDVNLDLGDGWVISEGGGNIEYCPLEFKVGDTVIYAKTVTAGSVANLELALEEAVANALVTSAGQTKINGDLLTKTANETPNTDLTKTVTVGWKWAYEKTGAQTGAVNSDDRDTKLGTLATMPKITFTLNIEITQLN